MKIDFLYENQLWEFFIQKEGSNAAMTSISFLKKKVREKLSEWSRRAVLTTKWKRIKSSTSTFTCTSSSILYFTATLKNAAGKTLLTRNSWTSASATDFIDKRMPEPSSRLKIVVTKDGKETIFEFDIVQKAYKSRHSCKWMSFISFWTDALFLRCRARSFAILGRIIYMRP